MLNENQERYLAKLPADGSAEIRPWNAEAAAFARSLIDQIKQDSDLETFWGGSLALGIPGQNDIDLGIFAEPADFDTHLPKIVPILGEPTYVLPEKILWRISKDGHKIDAGLISKTSPEVQRDMLFSKSLEEDPNLLQEYIYLKVPGLSAREYYRKKNEFYNRVTSAYTRSSPT